MTRDRGNRLQNALATYLTRWWPHAESAGSGRNGTDVLGTPGIDWECKTAADFKRDFRPGAWVRQSQERAYDCGCLPSVRPCVPGCDELTGQPDIPVVVYFPPGIGEANTANTLAIVPLHALMSMLQDAGYTPDPALIQTRKDRM